MIYTQAVPRVPFEKLNSETSSNSKIPSFIFISMNKSSTQFTTVLNSKALGCFILVPMDKIYSYLFSRRMLFGQDRIGFKS